MALDFPNSPVNGQQYNAPNGVMYIYSSANGLWMASGASTSSSTINATPPLNPYIGQLWWSPDLGQLFIYYFDGNSSQWVPATTSVAQQATAPGDFCATAIGQTFTSATAVAVPNTIVSGNSGGWYNSSNGRFTPPAGRYRIMASVFGYSASAVLTFSLNIRKNGTAINPGASASTAAANFWAQAAGDLTVDANGTDYFDFTVSSGSASTNPNCGITFSAIPVGVISYTTPAPGNLYLYSEQVLASVANQLKVNIPAGGARRCEIEFFYQMSPFADINVSLQGMRGATPDTGAIYNYQRHYASGTTATADVVTGGAGIGLGGGTQAWGKLTFLALSNSINTGVMHMAQTIAAGARYTMSFEFDINFSPASNIDGFRIIPASTNFAVGSWMRSYVVQ